MKNYLLKISISLLFILYFFSAISQNIEIDKRLEKAYSIEYLENLQKNSPSTLEILNYDLDHSWFLADDDLSPKAPSMNYLYYKDPITGKRSDKKVTIDDLKNINICEFYIEKRYDSHVFYKIEDSGTYIGFYSLKENAKNFNTYKKSTSYENNK